jgi:pimeloyl-ACP methyl ester carboxylesterase
MSPLPTEPTGAPIAVSRSGSGPAVVLVHGGLPARVTWARQEPLGERWTLIVPCRRGFMPSPEAATQDFVRDTEDLLKVLSAEENGAHLVGFSYGGLSAVLAASSQPETVQSLTVIEAPLWAAAPDDPDVQALASLADRFVNEPDDERTSHAFLSLAGVASGTQPLAPDIAQALHLGRRFRSPREAQPRFATIREARIPCMVVSGDHNPGLERVCDGLAQALGARRERLPGAAHAVPRAHGFNAMLESFLLEAQAVRRCGV